MALVIRVPFNAFKEVEARMKYRFWDKGRERSNRAAAMAAKGRIAARCLRNHDTIAWSGPPHDAIQCYICLHCHAAASEPEIRDKGFEFETIPDWEIHAIMDADLRRQEEGRFVNYRP